MMPMPITWVESIFQRLAVRYGREFTSKWDGLNPDDVKADWAIALSGFTEKPDDVAYALNNLPDRAPNVQEFIAICRRAPNKAAPKQIEGPAPDKQRILETARSIAKDSRDPNKDPHEWAKRPKSVLVFNAVLDLAAKTFAFEKILNGLREAGHVEGDTLINKWDGSQWVRV